MAFSEKKLRYLGGNFHAFGQPGKDEDDSLIFGTRHDQYVERRVP
jgi:hypothetical protein